MRRGLRLGAVVVAVVVLATACNADWTQFGFGAGNTRATSDTSINLVNADSIVSDWTGGTGAAVSSSPAVAGGVAYVGSEDGKLYAFSADGTSGCVSTPKTCTPLWTASTGGAIVSSPAVSGGRVFVGSNDGDLYAFDAAGGSGCSGSPKVCSPAWRAPTGGPVASSPTVADGVVYVGSNDGRLHAFDASGGDGCAGTPRVCEPLWTGATGGAVTSSPAVSDGTVFVGSADARFYAFDADGCSGSSATCAPRWTATTGGAITASAAVSGGKVFVASADAKLYAFDAAGSTGCSNVPVTCAPLWRMTTGGPIASSPAVAGGVLFVGSDDGRLYGVDVASTTSCSGAPLNCYPIWTSTALAPVRSSPAVVGGVAFVGSTDGTLRAFDVANPLRCRTNCAPVWSTTADVGIRSSPAVSGGRVYIGADDARLHAFKVTESTTPVPPVLPAPRAIPGDGEVTVRWTRVDPVDLPLVGYVVQPYRDGVAEAPTTVGPTVGSLTLTGLDREARYTFTVSVKVADVIGQPSPLSDGETPSDDLSPAAYQINPTHDGNKVGEPLPGTPVLKWSKTFNYPVSYPVAANGRVFVILADDGGSGGTGGRLYAFDQATGAQLWGPAQVGGFPFVTGMAYEDHKVFTTSYYGVVSALDEATGAVLWSVDMTAQPFFQPAEPPFQTAPTAYRGVVYISGPSKVIAVEGQTGDVLWNAQANLGDQSTPAVDRDGVYLTYQCGVSYRLAPISGAIAWYRRLGCTGGGGRAPVLSGGRLYVRDPSQGNVILDTASGDAVGSFASTTPPAIDGSLRFGVSSGTVEAVDTTTGQTLWTRTGDGTLASAPIVVGGLVVVGGTSGIVQAYDEDTGAIAWTLAAGAGIRAPVETNSWALPGMTTDEGRLFVAATNRLVAFG